MSDETHLLQEIVHLLRKQGEQLDTLLRRDDRIVSTMVGMDARREDARTEQASVRWEEREFRAQLISLTQKQTELLEKYLSAK